MLMMNKQVMWFVSRKVGQEHEWGMLNGAIGQDSLRRRHVSKDTLRELDPAEPQDSRGIGLSS